MFTSSMGIGLPAAATCFAKPDAAKAFGSSTAIVPGKSCARKPVAENSYPGCQVRL